MSEEATLLYRLSRYQESMISVFLFTYHSMSTLIGISSYQYQQYNIGSVYHIKCIQQMKKLFLKGKELLSKKLQQFDIETESIDYVGEQTPSRLKQSLKVLRENEIDLQDNHEYETYFKNYPNHHISHYLLDKFKSCKTIPPSPQPGVEPVLQYHPPPNPNTYIPPFNPTLQSMAISYKNSIQQYQQQYNKIEHPLICICVVHFHHKRGTQIQYCYPKDQAVNKISAEIVHHAMPDSSHLRDEDFNYFNFEANVQGKRRMLFGVSYFKQIKVTEQMKKKNSQLTRSHVQKSVTLITPLPLFEYLKIHLCSTTQLFFQNFTDYSIIKEAYLQINKNLVESWPNIQLPDLYMGCNLGKIVQNFGLSALYDIWKAILYEKRVVVYALTSSEASSFVLALISLLPGLSTFGICSKPISRYLQSLRQYSLPLRTFSSSNFLSISFHVQDFWKLSKFQKNSEGSFLLGTTNKLLKEANDYGIEMLINLTDNTITKNKARRPWEPLSKKQKSFITDLKESIECLQSEYANNNGGVIKSEELEDMIRGCFHQFLKSVLVQMILGIRDYQIFAVQCEKYEKALKKAEKSQQIKKNGSYDLMQDQYDDRQVNTPQSSQFPPAFPNTTAQISLPQLLLNRSFAYFRQFHNQCLPQILQSSLVPSIYINNYQYLLHITEQQFISYNWLEKRLIFGKGQPEYFDGKEIRYKYNSNLEIVRQITQETESQELAQKGTKINKDVTRSIYIGMFENGRYCKNGFYVDRNEYYQGEFKNGMKDGYGKFYTNTDKYIGNFVNNLYEGEGQLVKNGEVYVGSFKHGLKHGLGSLQGNEALVGEWIDDKFITEEQKNQANKKQKSTGSKGSRKGSEQQKI